MDERKLGSQLIQARLVGEQVAARRACMSVCVEGGGREVPHTLTSNRSQTKPHTVPCLYD
jgi:hypothetical protein